MARPSAAHDSGHGSPARPPPVTHSWIRILGTSDEPMSESAFRVIPVLDVKDRIAVHAIGGIRSHYRPLLSKLHPSSDPIAIARAYRDVLGLHDLYLA